MIKSGCYLCRTVYITFLNTTFRFSHWAKKHGLTLPVRSSYIWSCLTLRDTGELRILGILEFSRMILGEIWIMFLVILDLNVFYLFCCFQCVWKSKQEDSRHVCSGQPPGTPHEERPPWQSGLGGSALGRGRGLGLGGHLGCQRPRPALL